MIQNDDKFLKRLQGEFRTNLVKKTNDESEDKKNTKADKNSGETKVVSVDDVNNLIKEVKEESSSDVSKKEEGDASAAAARIQAKETDTKEYNDNDIWTTNVDIKDFIEDALKEAGAKYDEEIVDLLFVAVIQAMLGGKLDIKTDIDSVTTLNLINLNRGPSLEYMAIYTNLVNMLLTQPDESDEPCKSTFKEVKRFVLSAYKEIQKNNADNSGNTNGTGNTDGTGNTNGAGNTDGTGNTNGTNTNGTNTNGNGEVNPPVPDEPVVIDTPEKAINAIANSIDNAQVNGNMSIKDFLLQFKAEASQYFQLLGYGEQFADVIVMFMATAVSDTSGVSSGLMKDANLSAIKAKFLAYLQDLSFLNTTDGVSAYDQSLKSFNIEYLIASDSRTENGYRIGYKPGGTDHTYDKNITYGPDDSLNGALFIKFMVEYLKNDVYGGSMNAGQMKLIMSKVIDEFGKGGYAAYKPYYASNIKLGDANVRNGVDRAGDGSCLDDLFNAMMKVANDVIKPLDLSDLSSADPNTFISNLFGSSSSLTAAKLYSNESSYLLNNDLGVRGIIQSLVDISLQYNIHNELEYKDFLNVFIRMLYEKCGEQVVTSNGQPVLTKDILNKYFAQGNTVQDLKNFIESKELRNAYYMEYVLEDGGIDDVLDEYGFNQKVDGDCWLVACLHALNVSEAGKQIIADAVTDNGDGTWTVTFNVGWVPGRVWNRETRQYEDGMVMGAGQTSYTISLEEFFDALGTGWYGGGDPTLDLIEIATAKLRKEFDTWDVWDGWKGDMYLWGGYQEEMLKYLIGPYASEYEHDTIYVQQPSNRPGYAAEQTQKIKDWIYSKLDDGSIQPGTVGNYMMYMSYGGHAYAVTAVDRNGIHYVDPFHPETVKFISWADLEARRVKGSDGKYTTVNYIDFGYVELPTE